MNEKLFFASDYMEGAHPAILEALNKTNLFHTSGYGTDEYTASAISKIREACGCPEAEVHLLVGGTQTNAVVIDSLLRPCQGVLSAESGHINVHEAGAIERGGHKVLALPHKFGKITAEQIRNYVDTYYHDGNFEHMVMPGMVYLSHPTEYGTLYSKEELTAISRVCHENHMYLYLDGARLAYALACPENELTLKDLAELCDVFYIGGTKCGAFFGEAVVIPKAGLIPNFFSIIKQHGALFAKGRILGIQYDVLFTDGLYEKIGEPAIRCAGRIQNALRENGYQLFFESPTNQIFFVIENRSLEKLESLAEYSFMEKYDDTHTVIRFATSWATTEEDTDKLVALLKELKK